MNPLCGCGCGSAVQLATRNDPSIGRKKGDPYRFLRGHGTRLQERKNNWKGGRGKNNFGYVRVWSPSHPRANGGYVLEHILIVETAMGKLIRDTAPIHHFDENKENNSPSNLVACDSDAYHRLLHYRQRAKTECGNAGWLWCSFCHTWNAPSAEMAFRKGHHQAFHRSCRRTALNQMYHARKRRSQDELAFRAERGL